MDRGKGNGKICRTDPNAERLRLLIGESVGGEEGDNLRRVRQNVIVRVFLHHNLHCFHQLSHVLNTNPSRVVSKKKVVWIRRVSQHCH